MVKMLWIIYIHAVPTQYLYHFSENPHQFIDGEMTLSVNIHNITTHNGTIT